MGTAKGVIQLKIENFSQFAKAKDEERVSEAAMIQRFPWTLKVGKWTRADERVLLHCYLNCDIKNSTNTQWSCIADFSIRLVAQKESTQDWVGKIVNRKFSADKRCWDYAKIFPSIQHLMNPKKGFYDATTDTMLLTAEILANEPIGLRTRSTLSPLAIRMLNLLSSGNEADVRFLVGGGCDKREFLAHKGILTTVSDVFERMFQFDANSDNGDRIIEVPDVSPETFKVLLNYIYADKMDDLSEYNVFDVLYAAEKYNVARLSNECLDCVKYVKLSIDNMLFLLAQARLHNLNELINRCWTFIDQNANAVLAANELLQIDQELLIELFSRDQLKLKNADEIAVWNAALHWADEQCNKLAVDCTPDKRRFVLGPALYQIRVPLIQKDQFADIIVPTKIMTKEEISSVLLYHEDPTNVKKADYPLKFSKKSRAG